MIDGLLKKLSARVQALEDSYKVRMVDAKVIHVISKRFFVTTMINEVKYYRNLRKKKYF